MSRESGSQLDRIAACAASAVLPGAFEEAGYAAHRGTDLHRFITTARRHGRDAALAEAPAKLRDFCSGIDIDALKQYLTHAAAGEAAFVYNANSGETRYVGTDIGRKYPQLTAGDFPYSIDWWDDVDGEAVILDVKTGRGEVPSPEQGWQFRLAGIGCAVYCGADSARLVKAHLDEEARWNFDSYDATALDLDTWAEELRGVSARLEAARAAVAAGRTPDVYPSESACRWCPCIKSCPSSTGLVRHLPTQLQTLQDTMREMTVEQLGAGWPAYQNMKRLVEAIGEEYTRILGETPLPLPNGKTLVLGETRREYIDGGVALSVLVDKFGADIAQRATKASVTKESLKAAVGRDQFERALMLIKDAGGIDVKVSLTPRVEKAK